jgi:hypothetical protein
MSVRTARCCCGALSIETLVDPVFNGICHCDSCKRRTGGAFGWSLYFPEAGVGRIEGESRAYVLEPASGRQERHFCPTCGSTVFWRSALFAGLVGVAGGCFADPAIGEPSLSATDSRRCAWLGLPGSWTRIG